jgi:type I restriction enzyme S subunit
MAAEWTPATLGAVADFLSGSTPSKDNPAYWGGTTPWVSAKDMKRLRLEDTKDHLTDDGILRGSKLVPAGTVFLLTRGMTLLHDVPISVAARPMTFNQDVKALWPRSGVSGAFLPYLLLGNKHRLQSLVDLSGHGTGRLNLDELKAFKVLLPPESEQRAIAQALSALDAKAELNRRTNQTLWSMAQALFKSWFVDFDPVHAKAEGRHPRLPGHLADLFTESLERFAFGEIPRGWKVTGLDEIADFRNGLALQRYPSTSGDALPVIKIAQLRIGRTDGRELATANLAPEYIAEDGDVLFSWSGTLECVVWAGGRGAVNQHLFKVTSAVYPKWFYYLWIHQHLERFRNIAAGKATTMGHIQRHHLSEAKVVLPPPAVLQALDVIISPLIEDHWRRRVQSRVLAALRDTLLPKLISGELRIHDAERLIERHA